MTQVTFKGDPIKIHGELPPKGSSAPNFNLVTKELADVSLADYSGKRIVLNIFPSVDTPVCATSVRRFNQEVSSLENCVVLCVSMDLPFAHARFCGAEGLDDVVSVSDFRSGDFGRDYGVTIVDGPLRGLFSRAVVIIDEQGNVAYTQHVPEIAEEPDYEAALSVLKG
jgi:thiol peroxidase